MHWDVLWAQLPWRQLSEPERALFYSQAVHYDSHAEHDRNVEAPHPASWPLCPLAAPSSTAMQAEGAFPSS